MAALLLTFTNMAPCVFNGRVSIDIWQQTETEPFSVIRRIGVTVDDDAGSRRVKYLADAIVQFIICNRTPIFWLLICDWLNVYKTEHRRNKVVMRNPEETRKLLYFKGSETCIMLAQTYAQSTLDKILDYQV